MGTGKTDVLREKNVSCNSLISVYSISSYEWFNDIRFILGLNVQVIIDFLVDFFEALQICLAVDFLELLEIHTPD